MNLKDKLEITENDLFILVHNLTRSTSVINMYLNNIGLKDWTTGYEDLNLDVLLENLKNIRSSKTLIDKELDKFYLKCKPKNNE